MFSVSTSYQNLMVSRCGLTYTTLISDLWECALQLLRRKEVVGHRFRIRRRVDTLMAVEQPMYRRVLIQ